MSDKDLNWKHEKKNLVSRILFLKAENQRLSFQLNQKDKKIKKLSEELELNARKFNAIETEMNTMKQENQKHLLKKRKSNSRQESSDENVYEVEKVLAHKIERRKRYYFVRWKNYGPEHDSWVIEKDILSKTILAEYYSSK